MMQWQSRWRENAALPCIALIAEDDKSKKRKHFQRLQTHFVANNSINSCTNSQSTNQLRFKKLKLNWKISTKALRCEHMVHMVSGSPSGCEEWFGKAVKREEWRPKLQVMKQLGLRCSHKKCYIAWVYFHQHRNLTRSDLNGFFFTSLR